MENITIPLDTSEKFDHSLFILFIYLFIYLFAYSLYKEIDIIKGTKSNICKCSGHIIRRNKIGITKVIILNKIERVKIEMGRPKQLLLLLNHYKFHLLTNISF